jgi:hypothetical protein
MFFKKNVFFPVSFQCTKEKTLLETRKTFENFGFGVLQNVFEFSLVEIARFVPNSPNT